MDCVPLEREVYFVMKSFEDISDNLKKTISSHPFLSSEESISLFRIMHDASDCKKAIEARDRLICCNLGLALKWARYYYINYAQNPSYCVSLGDLFGETNIALVKAVDSFDVSKNITFATYASKVINNHILHILQDFRLIRIPKGQYMYLSKLRNLLEQYGARVSDKTLAQQLKVKTSYVKRLKCALFCERKEVEDIDIFLNGIAEREKETAVDCDPELMEEVIQSLKKKNQKVVRLFFFEGKPRSEIATICRLSRSRIGQILKLSLKTMRRKIERKTLTK